MPLSIAELDAGAHSSKPASFAGIDSEVEAPSAPDLTLNAGEDSEADCVQQVLQFLYEEGILPEEAHERLFDDNDDDALATKRSFLVYQSR